MRVCLPAILLLFVFASSFAQSVQITVNTQKNRNAVSPLLYGRNNSLSDDPSNPVSAATWQLYKDAGVRFFRENGGNDLTKYNWRLHLTSHPDWYNNVYPSNWDYAAQSLQHNIPDAQGMWGFQLIGSAASNTNNNFNDWGYNMSQWWSGVEQNLAGGGVVNPAGGSEALTNGNPSLYLENWTADSTTAILPWWFGTGGVGLDSTHIRYWNMDNEVEIWSSTHDDVMPIQPTAEAFLQLYFAVAKKARALYPGIKLTGPVSPNEWQWYNWNNTTVTGTDGKQYPWLQYFIKRVAEEEKSSGIRLLDVIDLHFYPSSSKASDVVQYGRVFFDSTYAFPEANGVKNVNGSWDNSIQIEDIFGRCRNWLNQYMGPDNGVTFGISEAGTGLRNNPNALAVWYGSTMGEMMKNGVGFFSPWTWDIGMWETLHLFSRYNRPISVQAVSSDEQDVSAYATTDAATDSLTIVLINRSTQTQTATLSFPDFQATASPVAALTLSNLPATETFVSHTSNALVTSNITPANNTLSVTLAPMSMTSLLVPSGAPPLSVPQLLSFTATQAGGEALLDFATAGEPDLASFDIQRSADSSSFAGIGRVAATDSPVNHYRFADLQPLYPVDYYRLRMIDTDSSSTFSKILIVRMDQPPPVKLFPNPAGSSVTIEVNLPAGPILLQLADAAGQIVRTRSLQSAGQPFSTTIDLTGLASGVYFMKIGGRTLNLLVDRSK